MSLMCANTYKFSVSFRQLLWFFQPKNWEIFETIFFCNVKLTNFSKILKKENLQIFHIKKLKNKPCTRHVV